MKKQKTISDHFKLGKTQYELDFFDCYVANDTPLFIDPWAIRCGDDEFSVNCYQKIQSVFSRLIAYAKKGEKVKALDLLDNLHEPRETGLGYSKKNKQGASVGPLKSVEIYEALLKSRALKSGLLNDLEDTALHIDGIGADNISDIITNIIRYELIKYTQEQCDLYKIPMTVSQTKSFWDESSKDFIQSNGERLLIIDGKKILLVPKKVLRRDLLISYSDFYQKGILEFEQSRHLDLRTSLCRTLADKTLAEPYKKTLKEDPRYQLSRELVSEYIDSNPELLDKYKKGKLDKASNPVSNEGILSKQDRNIDLEKLINEKIEKLKKIPVGPKYATIYHEHIFDCLNTIFNDPGVDNYLSSPKKEDRENSGRKRIDITFHNSSTKGFFSRLSNYGGLFCAKILFECKNFSPDIANPEYDQMNGRFNNRTSTIGYIVCRNIADKVKSIETSKDFVANKSHYIMVLTDSDIVKLLKACLSKDRNIIIDMILEGKIQEILSVR